jgi:hypothetical protein
LPGGGGTGGGSRGGLVISLSLDKGMPADRRAFPMKWSRSLFVHFVHLLRLSGLLTRLLVGLLLLALLLLALLSLALLLFTVLLGLRVAALGIVHR